MSGPRSTAPAPKSISSPAGRTTLIAAQNGIPRWYFHGLSGPHAGRRIDSADPAGTVSATLPPERAIGCVAYVTLHVQDNEIVKVTSPHDNPATHGNLCIKGRFGFQHVQNRV